MSEKHIVARIADAIDGNSSSDVLKLLEDNPEQIRFYTPFGRQTWLGYAAQIGKLDVVKALINAGFDLNTGDKRDNIKPICSAAANDHCDVVAFLLEAGADMDVSLSVRNPLFAAIVGRSPEIVRLLLRAGIDSKIRYNSKTMKNMDAVAFALMRGEVECAQIIALWNANGDGSVAKDALIEADRIAEENAR